MVGASLPTILAYRAATSDDAVVAKTRSKKNDIVTASTNTAIDNRIGNVACLENIDLRPL